MNEAIAIQVEDLGKRYRIGRRRTHGRLPVFTNPFRYLLDSLREPTADEVIWSLRHVSFEVQRGEVVGIVGRNGAGKSTLLKILSRITEPTEGRAKLNGRVGSLLEVGTGFHPELTGRENIYLSGTILGMKKAEIDTKLDEIVAFAEIEQFLDTQVKRYSSGMYVRLAFAVAAHLEPEVLLVDEVLAVGDLKFQEKCLGKMGEVAEHGRTILFVSHNMTAVQTLCPRSIYLEKGEVAAIGPSAEVIGQYVGQGASDSEGERVWLDLQSAPGCSRIRLTHVRVRDYESEETRPRVDIDKAFDIEIGYAVLEDKITTGATVLLWRDGQLVFSSISNNDAEWHHRRKPEGAFRSTCHVPANLLNDGQYHISVLLWTDQYALCDRVDRVLSFEALDSGATRGDYMGGWSGLMRPQLDWKTEYLGKQE